MNSFNQIVNAVATLDNADTSTQPMLVLDALDLAAVGGGGDVVTF
jgi:hypothetical protein